jgi:hypothetical protein
VAAMTASSRRQNQCRRASFVIELQCDGAFLIRIIRRTVSGYPLAAPALAKRLRMRNSSVSQTSR